jgi:tetratricopeptide (TPR) repeat protein
MRQEIGAAAGWYRLGQLMIKLGHFDKAEELYEILLKQASNKGEKAHLFHYLGLSRMARENMQKHFHIMKKHLKSDKNFFLQTILIWLLLTATSGRCMTT